MIIYIICDETSGKILVLKTGECGMKIKFEDHFKVRNFLMGKI